MDFDKKMNSAIKFDFNNDLDHLTYILNKLAQDDKNVYIELSNGKKFYAQDYKNLTETAIKQQICDALYGKTKEELNIIKDNIATRQEQLDKKSQRVSKLFDEIYSQGEEMIYSNKLPEWRSLIAKYIEMDDIKVVVDALAVMKDLNFEDFDKAKSTLIHLGGSKERTKEIEKIIATFSKVGPEFLQSKCITDLSEKDIILVELQKQRNQIYAKSDREKLDENFLHRK